MNALKFCEALTFPVSVLIAISVLMEFRWHNRALTAAQLVLFSLLVATGVIIENETLTMVSAIAVSISILLLIQPHPGSRTI